MSFPSVQLMVLNSEKEGFRVVRVRCLPKALCLLGSWCSTYHSDVRGVSFLCALNAYVYQRIEFRDGPVGLSGAQLFVIAL